MNQLTERVLAIDPICGMEVEPDRAAGVSRREGQIYYFCSTGCKQRFEGAAAAPASCCGGGGCSAPVALMRPRAEAAPPAASHSHAPAEAGDAEEEQARAYRLMMHKFWFAAAVSLPLLLLMFAEFVPALGEELMPYHRLIAVISAIISLPVLLWSGNQFFVSAWNGLRNHTTNMDTLVALGTGAAWLYSTLVVVAPELSTRE